MTSVSISKNKYKCCTLCPRRCRADRTISSGYCGMGAVPMAAKACLHKWEEPCIAYKNGAGTVFFTGCSLHCVYCQNNVISSEGFGAQVPADRLSDIFLRLQDDGADNIELVTPTHFIPDIIYALEKVKNRLSVPVVYNTGGYELKETIRRLEGLVDVYLPDIKYYSSEISEKYSNAPDYFEVACNALKEMTAQVNAKGGTKFYTVEPEADGNIQDTGIRIMKRGVIVRHMLLPGHVAESKRLLRYLHETYGNDIYISIMSQYTPMPQILESDRFPELKTKVLKDEYDRLVDFAVRIGIENAFIQEGDTAEESFIPAFDCEGV